jgi:hypothetical protein
LFKINTEIIEKVNNINKIFYKLFMKVSKVLNYD